MPKMAIASTRRLVERHRSQKLLQNLFVLVLLVTSMALAGCGDDDEDFEGADVFELQNTTWAFNSQPPRPSDLSAFNLEQQEGTLEIGTFGTGVLDDDEAPFTLTTNTGIIVEGSVDLDEGDVPVGQDFSRCTFEVDTSQGVPPGVPGLSPGDVNPMECIVTEDNTLLDLTNLNEGTTSTGTLVVQ